MSKSDHISLPELYKGMINLAKLFVLTVLSSVSDLHPTTDEGISSDHDLDSTDYPDCEIEKIKNGLVCHDLNQPHRSHLCSYLLVPSDLLVWLILQIFL